MEQLQEKTTFLSIVVSREDAFHLRAEIVGEDKGGSRSGHGKTKNEAIGNLVRINPDLFGKHNRLMCTEVIRPNSMFYRAHMLKDPSISSDNKKGHKSPDAAIGSMVRMNLEYFCIKEISDHGL